MKRVLLLVLVLIFFITILNSVSIFAATNASLTGPSVVRAGDTITLTYKVSANNGKIFGSSGELQYDKNQVTLSSISDNMPKSWLFERNGNIFTAYDNSVANPITSNGYTLFTAKFKVNSGVKTGDTIKISVANIKTSDGDATTELGTKSYSVKIAAPKSKNNNLSSLNVSNATISPAFNKSTTTYSTKVPFRVSKLDINAKTEDSNASVSISGNNLKVGNNVVSITVTAENGDKKVYKINVTREQDPNYKPSSEASLKSISIDGGKLSPNFNKDVTKYVVYVPYETESISLSGSAVDSKASISGVGEKSLSVGENIFKITCTAEDGTTTKDYEIIAVRMTEFNGTNAILPQISATPTANPTLSPTPTPSTTPTTPPTPTTEYLIKSNSSDVSIGVVFIVGILCLLAGGLGTWLFMTKRKKKRSWY